jgi:hypothetical protein
MHRTEWLPFAALLATVTHQLLPADHESRVHFCEWISNVIENDPTFLSPCFFSDEAWFHLDGYVNSQNSRFWNVNNPHLVIEKPLHPAKIGVWAVMSASRIFFLFFENTVNAAVYCNFVHEFAATLTEDEIFSGWFQQDNAPPHTANISHHQLQMYLLLVDYGQQDLQIYHPLTTSFGVILKTEFITTIREH